MPESRAEPHAEQMLMHDNRQDRAIVQAPLVAGRALYPGQRTECEKRGRIV